jgi:hypothetical protein
MNLIETKFNIDIDNEQQLQAYNAFITALKGTNGVAPTITAPVKDIRSNTQPAATTVAQPAATTVAQPAATTVAQPVATTVAQPAATTVAQPAPSGSNKLDAIRNQISAKVGNNRPAIMEKLQSWGFSSATELTVDKYEEFHQFLIDLP